MCSTNSVLWSFHWTVTFPFEGTVLISCPLSNLYIRPFIEWLPSFYDQISLKNLLDAWKESSAIPSSITIGRMSDLQDYDLKGHKCHERSKSPDRHHWSPVLVSVINLKTVPSLSTVDVAIL